MNITEKWNESMATATKTVKNVVDNCKLDGKIAEQQKLIKGLTKEIADLVLVRLDNGEEMSPEIMERYTVIQGARAQIEELEKERKVKKIVCPECGTKMAMDMYFCGKCGTRIKDEVMEEEVEESVEESVEVTEEELAEVTEEADKKETEVVNE